MSNERLELMVTKAFKIAEDFSHQYVTLEHVLCVILEDQDVIDVIVELGGDPLEISDHTYAYCHTELEEIKIVAEQRPIKTMGLERVFNRAFTQALFNGRQQLTTVDVLLSILSEKNSFATYICASQFVTRETLLELIADKNEEDERLNNDPRNKKESVLRKYCVNLNKEAEQNKLDPLIGRKEEVDLSLIHI